MTRYPGIGCLLARMTKAARVPFVGRPGLGSALSALSKTPLTTHPPINIPVSPSALNAAMPLLKPKIPGGMSIPPVLPIPPLTSVPTYGRTTQYLRDMAGLQPGERAFGGPIRSTKTVWNTAMTPFWDPYLRKAAPEAARRLRYATGAIAGAPIVYGGYQLARIPADAATEIASEAGIDYGSDEMTAIRGRAARRTPQIFWESATGSDPLARVNRRLLGHQVTSGIPYEIEQARQRYPRAMGAFDVASSMTPGGVVKTLLTRLFGSNRPPEYSRVAREALQEEAPNILSDVPGTMRSPLYQHYRHIMLSPESRKLMTESIGARVPGAYPAIHNLRDETAGLLGLSPQEAREWSRWSQDNAPSGLGYYDIADHTRAAPRALVRSVLDYLALPPGSPEHHATQVALSSPEVRQPAERVFGAGVGALLPSTDPARFHDLVLASQRTYHSPGIQANAAYIGALDRWRDSSAQATQQAHQQFKDELTTQLQPVQAQARRLYGYSVAADMTHRIADWRFQTELAKQPPAIQNYVRQNYGVIDALNKGLRAGNTRLREELIRQPKQVQDFLQKNLDDYVAMANRMRSEIQQPVEEELNKRPVYRLLHDAISR